MTPEPIPRNPRWRAGNRRVRAASDRRGWRRRCNNTPDMADSHVRSSRRAGDKTHIVTYAIVWGVREHAFRIRGVPQPAARFLRLGRVRFSELCATGRRCCLKHARIHAAGLEKFFGVVRSMRHSSTHSSWRKLWPLTGGSPPLADHLDEVEDVHLTIVVDPRRNHRPCPSVPRTMTLTRSVTLTTPSPFVSPNRVISRIFGEEVVSDDGTAAQRLSCRCRAGHWRAPCRRDR